MTPLSRPDVALTTALLEAGVLRVTDCTEVEVRHEVGCPMRVTARNTVCRCQPSVYVAGVEVTSA